MAATSATGKMATNTVKECASGLMAQATEESFETMTNKAKASSRGPMVINTSVSLLIVFFTEKLLLNGRTVANIQDDGRRAKHMEKEFTSTLKKKRFTVNGRMVR